MFTQVRPLRIFPRHIQEEIDDKVREYAYHIYESSAAKKNPIYGTRELINNYRTTLESYMLVKMGMTPEEAHEVHSFFPKGGSPR